VSGAQAVDFTFAVPIKLTRIHPAYTSFTVSCDVRSKSGGGQMAQLGMGSSPPINIVNGSYAGTVNVTVDSRNPNPEAYRCWLHFINPKGRSGQVATLNQVVAPEHRMTPASVKTAETTGAMPR
jgi:hypothetical protein